MATFEMPSIKSLLLLAKVGGEELSNATGFIVNRPGGTPLLITNWHVVSGRHHESRKVLSPTGGTPDSLSVLHNSKGCLGKWKFYEEKLFDEHSNPLWIEHPDLGSTVDVVGVPITCTDAIENVAYSYENAEGQDVGSFPSQFHWGASDLVYTIGFPFGWTGGGGFGIWVQGSVATEPDFPYLKLPRFLIDSRTRPGQSGSPVVWYHRGGWIHTRYTGPWFTPYPVTVLLGVYSGRLNKDSDLGTVWNCSVIKAIAEHGVRGKNPHI